MVSTTPQITQNFVKMIKEKADKGNYRVDVNGISIDVFPYIFPPESPFSESTHTVYDLFGHLDEQKVLDMGTGTGIQAIQASLAGAKEVDVVDIYDVAVDCAKHNVRLNGLEGRVNVWQSDLFEEVPEKQYDLIIANLPIVEVEESDIRFHSLFDPNFAYHQRLFQEAPAFLTESGKITLCHSDLQEEGFERLENVAKQYGFAPSVQRSTEALGHEWRNYEFNLEEEL